MSVVPVERDRDTGTAALHSANAPSPELELPVSLSKSGAPDAVLLQSGRKLAKDQRESLIFCCFGSSLLPSRPQSGCLLEFGRGALKRSPHGGNAGTIFHWWILESWKQWI